MLVDEDASNSCAASLQLGEGLVPRGGARLGVAQALFGGEEHGAGIARLQLRAALRRSSDRDRSSTASRALCCASSA